MYIQFAVALAKALFILMLILTAVPILVLAERRVSAWMQDRQGPNRVGPGGLLQPIADGIKFITKEVLIPGHVDRKLYLAAPAMLLVPALMTGAIIPWSKPIPADSFLGGLLGAADWAPDGIPFQVAHINVGLLYFFAMASLGVYGIILAGWASNNKYTLLGGLRASAQMISYELSLGLAILSVLLIVGTLQVNEIVEWQSAGLWLVFAQPVTWFIFTIAALAETNRAPFDLAECEQELVGGYHTEYGGMPFATFFLAEYGNMTMSAALNVSLFWGGYTLFGIEQILPWFLTLGIFLAKVAVFLFLFLWIRWTFPRFRYDQLMRLGWKMLLPLALGNVVLTALGLAAHEMWGLPLWPALIVGQGILIGSVVLVSVIRSKAGADTRAQSHARA
ncbi:MAG: NADH-quinone oxidoreductase subunit NuoH [Candidatus Poribacteria bacterium]